MANQGVVGRVVDEAGRPLVGLDVLVLDQDVLVHDLLGHARTDAEGRFGVFYRPEAYQGLVPDPPDVLVVVRDPLGIRELARVGPYADRREAVFEVPDVRVPRALAEGPVVTLGGATSRGVSEGNAVRFLVDGEEGFREMAEAVAKARRSVRLMQFSLRPAFRPVRGGPSMHDLLRDAAVRGVDVRVLLRWHAIARDFHDEARAWFRDHPSPAKVRDLPLGANTLHSKQLVVDDEVAWVIGHPFEPKYWDTRAHRAVDPARPEPPMHDATARFEGPVVRDLALHFAEIWNSRAAAAEDGDVDPGPPAALPARGRARVQVVRTMPPGLVPSAPRGERGVLESYQRALVEARSFVYVENQYFTSAAASELLRAALRERPGLEVILVLNEDVDVPTYRARMLQRLADLGWPDEPRVGAFTLWTAGNGPDGRVVRRIYNHSKVAVVDDAWATHGSANLDGISLEGAREFGVDGLLNVDLDVTFLESPEGAPAGGVPRMLRKDLWSELLGRPAPDHGPFLPTWRRVAERNLRRLANGETKLHGSVLPLGDGLGYET